MHDHTDPGRTQRHLSIVVSGTAAWMLDHDGPGEVENRPIPYSLTPIAYRAIGCMYCGNTGTVGGAPCPVCRPGSITEP